MGWTRYGMVLAMVAGAGCGDPSGGDRVLVARTVPLERVYLAQTPQAFRLGTLRREGSTLLSYLLFREKMNLLEGLGAAAALVGLALVAPSLG